jgi:hypothetical protein
LEVVRLRLVGALVLGLCLAACSSNSTSSAPPSVANPVVGPGNDVSGGTGATVKVVAAGDIGMCGSPGTAQTARLVAGLEGEVILAGDIAYMHGSAADFRDCFEPTWGVFRSRWRPVPGNHEYETPNARDYFQFFGAATADPMGLGGYYSFMAGDWLVLMLNSNIPSGRGSAQWEFARRQLDLQRTPCTLAVWHHPLFSSGPNGANVAMRDLWSLFEAAPVEVVLNGHDHVYERFARQMADGRPEPARGIRQFTVGTGGASLYPFAQTAANSEVRISDFGVIQLTLQPAQYRWEYRTVSGNVVDSGLETCR